MIYSYYISDTDECKSGGVYCQYGCVNLIGGYRCGCQPGFTQDYYFNQCVGKTETLTPFNYILLSVKIRSGASNAIKRFTFQKTFISVFYVLDAVYVTVALTSGFYVFELYVYISVLRSRYRLHQQWRQHQSFTFFITFSINILDTVCLSVLRFRCRLHQCFTFYIRLTSAFYVQQMQFTSAFTGVFACVSNRYIR